MQKRKDDPTTTAVSRQLKAMGLEKIEVSLIYPKVEGGPPKNRVFVTTPEDLIKQIPQLKRDNKQEANVFIRGPRDEDHALIFVDDIDLATPARMAADGLKPAVVVESSPTNYQGWIKLNAPQPAEIRLQISKILAGRYGGDPGATGAHQAGRLAGFTNRKLQYRGENGHPYAKLISGWGKPIDLAAEQELIAQAKVMLLEKQKKKSAPKADKSQPQLEVNSAAAGKATPGEGAAPRNVPQAEVRVRPEAVPASKEDVDQAIKAVWLEAYKARQKQNPGHPNLSEVDWKMCRKALELGAAPEVIRATLEDVADRKGKWAANYAAATVVKAVSAQERKAGLGESSSRLGRDHDRSRPTQDALQR